MALMARLQAGQKEAGVVYPEGTCGYPEMRCPEGANRSCYGRCQGDGRICLGLVPLGPAPPPWRRLADLAFVTLIESCLRFTHSP